MRSVLFAAALLGATSVRLWQDQLLYKPPGGPTETTDVSAGWFGAYLGEKSIPESTGGGVFELNQVISGQISLSASINQSVIESLCEPYPRPD